ncbi:hypothetical protein [Paenibacillus odorifer]|nr:hypothetical protein [Paenibacillus odorifer]
MRSAAAEARSAAAEARAAAAEFTVRSIGGAVGGSGTWDVGE